MKLVVSIALAVTLAVGLTFIGKEDPSDRASAGDAALALEDSAELRPGDDLAAADSLAPISPIEEREVLSAPVEAEPAGPPRLSGVVTNGAGQPLEGAVIYVLAAAPGGAAGDEAAVVAATTSTDAAGGFALRAKGDLWSDAADVELSFGVAATGYVRSKPRDLAADESQSGLEVKLQYGATIEGRVEDPDGGPVAGLTIWAGDKFAQAGHLSASRVQLRSATRVVMSPDEPGASQSVARTNRAGRIVFTGLPEAPCILRSLDPAWELLEKKPVFGGSRGLVWVAAPRFGIRIRASLGGAPLWRESDGSLADIVNDSVLEVSSRIRVELVLGDGSLFDTGQWIGSGPGEVTLTLTPEMDPRVDMNEVKSATFYGTAKIKGGSAPPVEWRSETLLRERMLTGEVPTVNVDFEVSAPVADEDGGSSEEVRPEVPMTDVMIDVRVLGTGAPFDGPLYVDWASQQDGRRLDDNGRARKLGGGRYAMRVPVGKVYFEVAVSGASGSLAPWSGAKECEPNGRTTLFVELDAGGEMLIHRPPGWSGQWWIKTARRVGSDPGVSDEEAEWFGAWAYSIDAPIHPLRALEAGRWRIELREDPDQGEPSEIRYADIETGDSIDVR